MDALVSTAWLADHLDEVIVFDATKYLPNEGRNGAAEFAAAHIPGARFFDIDVVADPDSALPHMVPSAGRFERLMGEFGVSNDSVVVFYDQKGIASSARLSVTRMVPKRTPRCRRSSRASRRPRAACGAARRLRRHPLDIGETDAGGHLDLDRRLAVVDRRLEGDRQLHAEEDRQDERADAPSTVYQRCRIDQRRKAM